MDLEQDGIRQTFIIESRELLQDMENALLSLEASPRDSDAINALFRAAHTIKGSAGIVGIDAVERFTHGVESLLERVRQGEVSVTGDLIELLLKCRDHIVCLVDGAASGDPAGGNREAYSAGEGLSAQVQAYLKREAVHLSETTGTQAAAPEEHPGRDNAGAAPGDDTAACNPGTSQNWHISLRFGPNVLRDGMDPLSFITYLSRLGEIVCLTTLIEGIPPTAEMDPESCYLGFEIDFKSDFDKKAIEDVFEFVQEECTISILPPHSKTGEYIRLIQDLPEDPMLLGELLIKGGALTRSELEEALRVQSIAEERGAEQKPHIGEILVQEGVVHQPVVDAAVEKQKKSLEHKAQEGQTIRIDTGKLDHLINLVGELVIAGANINQQAQRLHDADLSESASVISRLIEEIRDRAMKVRMVPIGDTFNRFHRVIRDINRESGKDIELVISGGDTELDKNVVERIGDPLMHLVRNSADHGIEKPEVRSARGKSPKGTIRLNAYHDAGSIVIEVSDDGNGLNREKILRKAVERGIAAPNQNLSDREVFRFIFEAGFSTADQVTRLSGRGVGMDVVRKNIEALRGSVEVESREAAGTAVLIRLPLTLAIIDGFLVRVGTSFYVVPLDMVVECMELAETDRRASSRRHYINLRGEVLSYVRLREIFHEKAAVSRYENIVVVQYAGRKTGLVVDTLHGEVQAVIKSLGKLYREVEGISGATILGDGTVALIIDVPHLVKSVEREEMKV
ncbi:MAG: chemotaxis protein CheA [Alphaproteobacteria bacterium]|uniref:Chemotaxis protein CheA n=1 Tax=Candidatus Nitrobium versatile TaxID=2884831 RepID=A0A953M1S6_9BACT|nr:chemotaxis protein CheA [Candidatus Nitrobium versatile]